MIAKLKKKLTNYKAKNENDNIIVKIIKLKMRNNEKKYHKNKQILKKTLKMVIFYHICQKLFQSKKYFKNCITNSIDICNNKSVL